VKGLRNDVLTKARPEQPTTVNDHNESDKAVENHGNAMSLPKRSTFLEIKKREKKDFEEEVTKETDS
jgi:hypothetical protein